jgi:DNA polymerase III alpha subunit
MKIDLGNRIIHEDGTVICKQSALVDILYAGHDLSKIFCNDIEDQTEWSNAARLCDSQQNGPVATTDPVYQNIKWYQYWSTPEPWSSIDLVSWCNDRCKTEQELQRVNLELKEMERRGMFPIIRHLIYCANVWRENGIVWGVGRGSSVCSFVLYLTGINRINPLEYELDIEEWLK